MTVLFNRHWHCVDVNICHNNSGSPTYMLNSADSLPSIDALCHLQMVESWKVSYWKASFNRAIIFSFDFFNHTQNFTVLCCLVKASTFSFMWLTAFPLTLPKLPNFEYSSHCFCLLLLAPFILQRGTRNCFHKTSCSFRSIWCTNIHRCLLERYWMTEYVRSVGIPIDGVTSPTEESEH